MGLAGVYSPAMISLTEWQAHGSQYQHRGHVIFCMDDTGPGDRREPLLLIHGFPTASWDWAPIWEELATRYRLLAADMIGFGYSAKPQDYDYSILDQATLYEGFLASRGITRVHLLAHDYGDTVAQELLARQLDRRKARQDGLEILSCCFLNGGLFPEVHRARLIQKLLLTPLGPLLGRLNGRRQFGRSFSAVFGPGTQPTPEELDAFWQLVSHNDGNRIFHKLIRYIPERRLYRARWVGAVVSSVVPLRFINGALDPVSGEHARKRYVELVPNPDTVSLPHVGHYPQVEAPADVLRHYLEFRERWAAQGGRS